MTEAHDDHYGPPEIAKPTKRESAMADPKRIRKLRTVIGKEATRVLSSGGLTSRSYSPQYIARK
jgi:hypothetical protein